jgi:hypothetical protein
MLFKSVTLSPACEPCIAAGTHQTCDHVVAPDAGWISSTKTQSLMVIFEKDPHMRDREFFAMVSDNRNRAYAPLLLTSLARRHASPAEAGEGGDPFSYVVLTADPADGGRSELALTAFGYRHNGSAGKQAIVLLLAAQSGLIQAIEESEFLDVVILALRAHPGCSQCPIIFIPEGNLASLADRLGAHVAKSDGSVCVMRERSTKDSTGGVFHDGRSYGVIKTKEVTDGYQRRTERALTYEQISFSPFMVGIPSAQEVGARASRRPGSAEARDYMQEKLIGQLKHVHWDEKGKLTGKHGSSGEDDLAITFQMAEIWTVIFWDSTYAGYAPFKRAIVRNGGRGLLAND